MIRHLRSCHVQEYQQVQEARQSTLILKMGNNDDRREPSIGLSISRYRKPAARHWQLPPVHSSMLILNIVFEEWNDLDDQQVAPAEEKARAQLLREMNTHVASTMVAHINKKTSPEPQKSPSASSSSSDTASSASSLFGPALPPVQPLSIAPVGLPAPKPVKLFAQQISVKHEATEVEDDVHEPTDLSAKPSAFATLNQKRCTEEIENGADQKPLLASVSRNFQLRNVDERKINAQNILALQIAMMMLIDQIPSKIVDGHGFRSLMSFLLPEYPMPSAALFESTICPEVITQIQPHLATLFVANNPHANPFESLMQLLEKRQTAADDCHTVSLNGIASEASTKRDDDKDNSCCVGDKTAVQPLIEEFTDYVGRLSFTKDELTSLLTVCQSVFEYFKDRPALMSELSLTIPIVETNQPVLLRDVLFVAEHAERINAYIRATPDMTLLPISDAQSQTLSELIRLVQKI
uniref:U-box domain-containing protein n=1 Tax=Angiostrongylus cantonensis TaxID=6313 RepID=A0A158P8Q4_ANGCA